MTPVERAAAVGASTVTTLRYPAENGARARLVLAHGAGADQRHRVMVAIASRLAARGVEVVTFNFLYTEQRRRTPDRAPVLEQTWETVVDALAGELSAEQRLVIGGKSMGGRMATHLAAAPESWPSDVPALTGVVVFGYPLQPPGGSKRSPDRVSHLMAIRVPTLIVQGTRDSFGGPADITAALTQQAAASGRPLPPIEVYPVEGGDHSLTVRRKTERPVDYDVWDRVAGFASSV